MGKHVTSGSSRISDYNQPTKSDSFQDDFNDYYTGFSSSFLRRPRITDTVYQINDDINAKLIFWQTIMQ